MADVANTHLTNKLSNIEKKEFYNSVMDNNVEMFKSYLFGNEVRGPYDIFEEVSAPGYNWTTFHYAMHYGKWEIIKYIIEYLTNSNLLDIAFKMKTNDNRCPMLCLLKSKSLDVQKKKEIYFKLINDFQIPITEEVMKEALYRHFYDNISNYNGILKNELTIEEKMNFYNSAINGNLEEFKSYINGTPTRKPYDIFEEVSAPGFNWTTFHYAMHYGKWEIIKYIIDYLFEINKIEEGLNLKTCDKRCPLLCLLKSNSLSKGEKREVFSKIIENYEIPISHEVKDELFKRDMGDLLHEYS